MAIFQIRNGILRFTLKGMALYNPSHYDALVIIPLYKIQAIEHIHKTVRLQLSSGRIYDWTHDTLEGTERQFLQLEEALEKTYGLSVPAVKPAVKPAHAEGPAPDVWALEQLK